MYDVEMLNNDHCVIVLDYVENEVSFFFRR